MGNKISGGTDTWNLFGSVKPENRFYIKDGIAYQNQSGLFNTDIKMSPGQTQWLQKYGNLDGYKMTKADAINTNNNTNNGVTGMSQGVANTVGIGQLALAGFSYLDNHKANKFNMDMANKNYDLAVGQLQDRRKFQKNLSKSYS